MDRSIDGVKEMGRTRRRARFRDGEVRVGGLGVVGVEVMSREGELATDDPPPRPARSLNRNRHHHALRTHLSL